MSAAHDEGVLKEEYGSTGYGMVMYGVPTCNSGAQRRQRQSANQPRHSYYGIMYCYFFGRYVSVPRALSIR